MSSPLGAIRSKIYTMGIAPQPAFGFCPKTERIQRLAKEFPYVVTDFEAMLDRRTHIYVDYGNVRPWADKLGWHVDIKRLYQLFDSFPCPKKLNFYYGTMTGDSESEKLIENARNQGYSVTTKPVKRIRISIDASSISSGSPD